MVARINESKNIHQPLRYNELKVIAGAARCIYAGNFLKEADQLSWVEKRQWFVRQIGLNPRITHNSQHISLNFAPGETISKETLIAISNEYMEKIGFGEQPFLVYEHLDAGHPHIHIITTCIRHDGRAIDHHNVGVIKSMPATIAIEKKYGLIQAQNQKKEHTQEPRPHSAERLIYGKLPSKSTMTTILDYVLHSYAYRDLDELNAVLRLYNLRADPGKEGGVLHAHHGLLYQMLDAQGNDIGVPIKASAISFKPTLKWLESQFALHQQIEPLHLRHVAASINNALGKETKDWQLFTATLRQQQIAAVPDSKANVLGLTFIDLDAKVVIKASELGANYTHDAILDRLSRNAQTIPDELNQKNDRKISKIRR